MHCIWMIILNSIAFTFTTEVDASTPLQPPSQVLRERQREEAQCWMSSTSTDKYPYHATVVFNCDEKFPHFGVIISANYILATTYSVISWEKPCNPTVYVGSDEQGNYGSKHEAELIQIGNHGELSLFKLKNPITFGSRAQAIRLVEVGEGAKSNDKVTLTALQQQPLTSTKRKVYAWTITVKSAEDCKKLLSKSHSSDAWQCNSCLWSYSQELLCPVWRRSVLIQRDRLIGLEKSGNSFTVDSGHVLEGYFNIEYYRATIKNVTGI
ncbi:hypothetical protein QAD02_018335 [Eretmocerus hayati]|uniref:Uncharacterized protein n=1 Tax=Eretmocerus hayati TaxID=131215 RepID=A0ACC2PHN5_9HYME|nr:hypothetical protein QAD02_018335 [Eretmocerus hayati]